VRRHAHISTIPTRTSHRRQREQSSSCPLSPRTQCRAVRHSLSHCRLGSAPWRTRQASDGNAAMQKVWPTHSSAYPCSLRRVPKQGPLPLDGDGVLIDSNPSAIVSIERQFSCIFPAPPRSLASVLIPRPAARRVSASHGPERQRGNHGEVLAHAPCGFRLSENLFDKSPHKTRTKRFSEPSEKAPLGLGSGAHSRRFAQECPEGNPGKYTKEK
jgi:hypothetical protein